MNEPTPTSGSFVTIHDENPAFLPTRENEVIERILQEPAVSP